MKVGQPRTRTVIVGLGLGLAALLAGGGALLWWGVPTTADDTSVVPERTASGTPERWPGGTVTLDFDDSANPDVPLAATRDAFATAIATWQQQLDGCGPPSLSLGGTVSGRDVAYDHVNVVLWRLPGYCDNGAHADDDLCVAPASTAMTTLFYVDRPGDPHDGDTLEADIELNAANWRFASDGSADRIDLLNTVVHELGHVYGLDHTCAVDSVQRYDLDGTLVPPCSPRSQLPPRVTRATMFNFESPGETSQRVPQPNEARGLCRLYDGALHTASAPSSPGGTTSTSGHGCEVVF